jgi:hypothetical protein
MALPRISAKSYNYGAYANPTPIKYKGGLGEGLAQAGTTYFLAKKEAADKKAVLDAKNLIESQKQQTEDRKDYLSNYDAFMKGTEDIVNMLDPHNALFLKEMAEDFAENRLEFKKTGNFEKFTIEDSKLKKDKQAIINLFEIAKSQAEKENNQPFSFYKQIEGNLDRYGLSNALSVGKIKLDRDEDGELIAGYGMIGNNENPKLEYAKIYEINSNPDTYTPIPKFTFDNKKYEDYGKLFQNQIESNPEIKTKIISRKSGGIEYADLNSAINFVKESKAVKEEALRVGKSVWEDVLGNDEPYDVTKHLDEIETVIAGKIIDNTNLKIGKMPAGEDGDKKITKLNRAQIDKLKKLAIDILPHDKQAATIDMNKIVSGLQEFGLTIEEDPDKPGYQVRSGGTGKMFTISPNSPAEDNLISITNALGIAPIDITEDMEFSLYKRK